MSKSAFTRLLPLLIFISIVGGGYAVISRASPTHVDTDGHEDHEGHDHDGHSSSHEKPPVKLSPQSLKNLGVETAPLEMGEYTVFRSIGARVEETSLTSRPVYAPMGGVVESIQVAHGMMVKGGQVLVTILRDPIPRPELRLTGQLLDPAQRWRGVSPSGIVSHAGVSSAGQQTWLWKEALLRNGHWLPTSDELLKALPTDLQQLPFALAVIGELGANGLLSADLVSWLTLDAGAGSSFFDIASLLLSGHALAHVRSLHKTGALGERMEIRAPSPPEDWDIHGIGAKPGAHVEAGDVLLHLHNPRELHVVAHPRGHEIPPLLKAFADQSLLEAIPLSQEAGPRLEDLRIQGIEDGTDGEGVEVHLEVATNDAVIRLSPEGRPYRSWALRSGSPYLLRVPSSRFKDVYVLPLGAVTEEGPDKVVYVRDGDSFRSSKVVVVHQDDEKVVLGEGSELFPGDEVVTHGAFALGLALRAGDGAADPHAGHMH
ncbi:MAG: hypothetical protein AB7F75_08705 [Planctomycetota bacterium]